MTPNQYLKHVLDFLIIFQFYQLSSSFKAGSGMRGFCQFQHFTHTGVQKLHVHTRGRVKALTGSQRRSHTSVEKHHCKNLTEYVAMFQTCEQCGLVAVGL